jgi:hypothetical protein
LNAGDELRASGRKAGSSATPTSVDWVGTGTAASAEEATATLAFDHALQAAGRPAAPVDTIKVHGHQVTACSAPTAITTPTTAPGTCATYSQFVLDRKGRLVAFNINGAPLTGRLAGQGQPSQPALGTALTVTTAYQSPASGILFIILSARGAPDGPRNVFVSSGTYVEPSGQQLQVIPGDVAEPLEGVVQPNATASMIAAFPGAAVGGTLTVPVSNTSDLTQSGQLQVQVG